jgi:hypothetical protein
VSKTVIHVNGEVIRFNKRHGTDLPVFTVQAPGKRAKYAQMVHIEGPCMLVSDFQNPRSNGAVAWIETESRIVMVDADSFEEVRDEMRRISKADIPEEVAA